MKIEGNFTVAAPRARVWESIIDPGIVGPCVPGCGAVEVIDDTHYKATVSLQVGPIKARFNITVEVTSEHPPEEIHSRTRGEEGSRASTLDARNILRLEALSPEETVVYYESDVAVLGRLGKFGLGVMKKKVQALGDKFADNFRAKVEAVEAA